MEKDYKNKMVGAETPPETKTKTQTQSWHFAGGGEYEPMAIEAATYEEALEKWLKERKKVELTYTITSES